MKVRLFSAICLALLLAAQVCAHEYWFEPETFFPAPNQPTAVHLYVGDGLVKDREERPFQAAKTSLFQLFSSTDTWDVQPTLVDGALPAYNFSAARPGTYLLALARNWSYIKLDAQKFEEYLHEDGLDYISVERRRLGESAREGRERYSRYLTTLLQVGDTRDATYKKRAGLRLEIMPLANPYAQRVGAKLTLQILFDGRPLAGRTVFADTRNGPTQSLTTDRAGRVTFKLDRSGLWVVRLVVMQRCATDCGEADWESFWGALSFGVR